MQQVFSKASYYAICQEHFKDKKVLKEDSITCVICQQDFESIFNHQNP
jgi:hypothetical protein